MLWHGMVFIQAISDLERFGVKPGARVANAVNMIDSWSVLVVRYETLLQ